MESKLESLSIMENKPIEFTLENFSVKTKISNENFNIFLPKEIIEFITQDDIFTSKTKMSAAFIEVEKLTEILFSQDIKEMKDMNMKEMVEKSEEEKEEVRNKKEINQIDLTSNPYINDKMILKALFAILGSVNSKNDFLQFTSDDYLSNLEDSHYLENFSTKSYQMYLEKNITVIFSLFKMKDFDTFIKAMKFIGVNLDAYHLDDSLNSKSFSNSGLDLNSSSNSISISKSNSNPNSNSVTPPPLHYCSIYTNIKKYIMSQNKILLVLTPSNNFWLKAEKITIGSRNYDRKLNNYSYIFYNWQFIHKFYDRIGSHPRCAIGFLNSMLKKNLQPCIESIPIMVKNFTKYIIFDQECHDNLNIDTNAKPNLVRNFEKMKSSCKNYVETNFNETNMLILESEKDKVNDTKDNSLLMNVFSEEFMTYSPEEIEEFNQKIERILCYLEKLLNECTEDIRLYLSNNPL